MSCSDDIDGVFFGDIDDAVRAQFLADRQALVARSRQDHGACAERLCNGYREQPDRAGADDHDAFTGNQPAEFGEAVHRRSGRYDERGFGVAHGVGHPRQRVDVVDGVFGEPAVGREAVGAVTLLGLSIVEARGVHALAAALALAAAGMDFHADALADRELVDGRSEGHDRAHIFMAGRKVLVEGQAALNARRRSAMDDLKVGGADGNGVDPDQDFCAPRHRGGLVAQQKLVRVSQNPGFHLGRGREIRAMS